MPRKKILLIVAVVLFLILLTNISRLMPEQKNYERYSQALFEYSENDFSDAYYTFGKISKFSKLKSAAIYRQALCSEKLGDEKTELKKYKEVMNRYPNSILAIRSRYLRAQIYYEKEDFKKAKKDFKFVLEKFPDTDYALGSMYYLGAIELENAAKTKNKKSKLKAQNKAVKYFKTYLNESPTGRFATYAIQKWESFRPKLNNEDNLLIAKVYQANQDYENARRYLKFTNLSLSWPYFVKNAYETKDYSKVKYYTVQGLKNNGSNDVLINEDLDPDAESQKIYEALDLYLKTSNDPKTSISYLLSISKKNHEAYEYLFYKNCNNLPINSQTACFNTLFAKNPDGRFAAESLANSFYAKIRERKYFMAKKLGREHLVKYPNSKSAPKVMFWLGKVAQKTKNYEEAKSYFTSLIRKYPDDYYAYSAFIDLKRIDKIEIRNLEQLPVEFPYKNSSYEFITELAKVKDYGLINQLFNENEFIQSWLAYMEGDFSKSAVIARDAMEKIYPKPDVSDLRWRLVYPVHYYDEIKENADEWGNNPILILSIIREESYFNLRAKSHVGASGLMQLMPATASEAARRAGYLPPNGSVIFNPSLNIKLGNIYYSNLKGMLSGKDILAVLAYNGGIGSVSRWKEHLDYSDADDFIEQIPYPETQNYLKKVYRSYWNYLRIYTNFVR